MVLEGAYAPVVGIFGQQKKNNKPLTVNQYLCKDCQNEFRYTTDTCPKCKSKNLKLL